MFHFAGTRDPRLDSEAFINKSETRVNTTNQRHVVPDKGKGGAELGWSIEKLFSGC